MYFIALGTSYIVFLFLTVWSIFLKPKYFLFFFLILMYIAPTAQYLVYVGVGETYTTTTFQRCSLELLNILLLLFYIRANNIRIQKYSGHIKILYHLLIIWNLWHLVNVTTALNPTKAFIFYCMGVLGPSLFLHIMINAPSRIIDIKRIPNIIFLTGIAFFSFGVFAYLFNVNKAGFFDLAQQRTAGGLYLTNFSVGVMAVFFPFAIISNNNPNKTTKYSKVLFLTGIVVMLVAALSRTGIIAYPLYLIFIRISSIKKFLLTLTLIFAIGIGMTNIIENQFGYDLVKLFTDRFVGDTQETVDLATIEETTKDDERFRLYNAVLEKVVEHPDWLFLGVGIGNYREIYYIDKSDKQRLFEYSNAHSTLANMLIERGIFILILFIGQILFITRIYFRVKKKINPSSVDYYLLSASFHGILFCLALSSDLIEASGNQTGLQAYLLFINYGIILQIYNNYSNKSN